ncbi:hypothetical protein TWF225_004959 [Orbilia oligospora]|nr:hypothetical protein TWF225_004959 [Orbilia oligospora]KAF3264962.1 hypothetical protein TWF217_002618 [Orbilia oligospora]
MTNFDVYHIFSSPCSSNPQVTYHTLHELRGANPQSNNARTTSTTSRGRNISNINRGLMGHMILKYHKCPEIYRDTKKGSVNSVSELWAGRGPKNTLSNGAIKVQKTTDLKIINTNKRIKTRSGLWKISYTISAAGRTPQNIKDPKEEYSQEQQVRKGQQRQLHQSEGRKEQEQEQGSDWAQESEQEQESGWEQESTQAQEPEGFQEQELEQGNQGTQKQQTHQPHQEQQNQQFSQSSKFNDQTPTQFRSQNVSNIPSEDSCILGQPPLAQTFQITSDTNTQATASSSLKSRTSEDNTSSIAKLFELILSYLSPRGSSNDEEALMERIKAIDTDREETIASIQELEEAAREKDNDIATLQGEMQEMRQDINQMQKQLGQSAKQNQMLRKTLDQLRSEEHQKDPGIKGCKSLRQRPTFPVKFEVYDPDTGTTETGTIIPYGSS